MGDLNNFIGIVTYHMVTLLEGRGWGRGGVGIRGLGLGVGAKVKNLTWLILVQIGQVGSYLNGTAHRKKNLKSNFKYID